MIGFPESRATGNPNSAKHLHEKFLTELAENHPLSHQLRPSNAGSVRTQTAALLLFQEFTDFLPQVAQAQALAASFGKVKKYGVSLCFTVFKMLPALEDRMQLPGGCIGNAFECNKGLERNVVNFMTVAEEHTESILTSCFPNTKFCV